MTPTHQLPGDGVRYLTLDRPEKKNAISSAMRTQLLAELQSLDHDPDTRVTIIRGAGDCFSAALTIGLLQETSLEGIAAKANQLASYVCTQAGGMPDMP